MRAGKFNFTVNQGARFDKVITYKQANGTPFDLSASSAKMQVREFPGGPVLVEFNSDLTANGQIFMTGSAANSEDGANGNMHLVLTTANSQFLPSTIKPPKYDYEVTDAASETDRILEGNFNISLQITGG